jgi:CheY-like chemotaxis protein
VRLRPDDDDRWSAFDAALRGMERPGPEPQLRDRCLPPAGYTVLVVDDEPNIRHLIRLHLERLGCEVVEAADGVEALARVPELRPDLIVLDVMMPGPSGFEVVTILKSDPRVGDIPIVLLTAKDEYDDIRGGWQRGADNYLTKPFNPEELRAMVQRMLAVRGTPEEPPPFRPWNK